MELDTIASLTQSRLHVKISRQDKSVETFADDVLTGLSDSPKTLSPKYFYNAAGSRLFEDICRVPEYYLTRTESGILKKYADEIVAETSEETALIELGSGNSTKTRLLLRAFLQRSPTQKYIPIDISKSILVRSSKKLLQLYPGLRITAYVSDYHTALHALKKEAGAKLIIFLGSSIGNFDDAERLAFFQKTRDAMGERDQLLVGFDHLKDRQILEAAYNDAQGVTAAFNFNLLVRINEELDGSFDLETFRHRAFLSEKLGRVEMHLESLMPQTVPVGTLGRSFDFAEGETIHTENSYKFTNGQIRALARHCGFRIRHTWNDERNWFSLNLLRPA